ncbi:O-acetyl-ADP-ribose deacetylase [Candidatus Latescibacterota bacterium]
MDEFMDGRVIVKVGDITIETVDAIVNAANSSLLGGGGVDGAIHRAGGPSILEECKAVRKKQYQGGLPTGQAVATTAGNLPAKYVIHTVGPVWHGGSGGEDRLLADCYRNSLIVAYEGKCTTVAFPAISTGVYCFPKDLAAVVASKAVKEFLGQDETISKVEFVFFSEGDAEIFLDKCMF